jgi:heat shock protein HslJ
MRIHLIAWRTARASIAVATLGASIVAACSPHQSGPASDGLTGTSWRFVEFRSNDDRIGVVRPTNPASYTMSLEPDGRVSMRLDCNSAAGTWEGGATGGESGSFRFGPLAMTRVYCPQPSMDVQIARDAEYVRSYLLRDGRLYLDLMADGGTYVWEPAGPGS